MHSHSLWRTLPQGARAISLLPIATFTITSSIFFYLYLGAPSHDKGYFLIGFIVWIPLAFFLTANLVLESTEKRRAGLLEIPPMPLIALNILNLFLVLFWVLHVMTNLHLYIWESEGGHLVCNILTRASVTAWGLSFALGNLLLYVAYAEFRVLTNELGVLARRISLLNGIISLGVFTFSVYVSITGILCGGH